MPELEPEPGDEVEPTDDAVDFEDLYPAQPGPQRLFRKSRADIAIYGGAAGGGKSWSLLTEPLQHVTNGNFGAVIFRRTNPEITNEGGLWDESVKLYPLLQAEQAGHSWRFDSGASITFGAIQLEKDVFKWKSSQICLMCVASGTPIVMADGSRVAVDDVREGDYVMTLAGPRRITRKHDARIAKCVTATIVSESGDVVGSQTHPENHPILTSRGWESFSSISKRSQDARKRISRPEKKSRSRRQSRDTRLTGRMRRSGRLTPLLESAGCMGVSVSSVDAGSGSVRSGGELREASRPQVWCVQVVLHERSLLEDSRHGHLRSREDSCGQYLSSTGGCSGHCFGDSGQCGELPQARSDNGQESFPSQGDAGGRILFSSRPDGVGRVQERTQRRQFEFDHPYTKERRLASEDVQLCSCELTPVGERTVFDLTIEGENHYVSSLGFVNQNCFDELTSFTEKQFWYMLSRNRSVCGIKPYVRATTNPDADSWVAELVSWWIDQETGVPIPDRAGVLRWFVRVDDVLVWGDSAEELRRRHPGSFPKSLTFIPAKLEDNPALERLDPGYRANLMALPTVERERLLGGNWKVRLTGGMFFRAGSIGVLDYEPTATHCVRAWDLAALEGSGDWTVGLKMGVQTNGRYVILDMISGQWETGGRDARIKQAADMDGVSVHQRLPQDPGQAGKSQVAHFARMLNGCNWSSGPVIGNKATRATRFAAAVNSGQVDMVRADWNKRLLDRLDRFPDSSVPDDEVDACADAFNTILDGCWISDETEMSSVSA